MNRLEKQLEEYKKRIHELESKLDQVNNEKEQILSALRAIPDLNGYIKDEDGRFKEIIAGAWNSAYLNDPAVFLGKSHLEVLNEKADSLKLIFYHERPKKYLHTDDFSVRIVKKTEAALQFYYKIEDTWELLDAIPEFWQENLYIGFMLSSGSADEKACAEIDSISLSSSDVDSVSWNGIELGVLPSHGSFEAIDDGISICAQGTCYSSLYYVYKRVSEPFRLTLHFSGFHCKNSNYRQFFGVMLSKDLSGRSENVQLLYRPVLQSLNLSYGSVMGMNNGLYRRLRLYHEQDMNVINSGNTFKEELSWITTMKVPCTDLNGSVKGMLSINVYNHFRQILDDLLDEAIIVFTTKGIIKIHNRRALEVLQTAFGVNSLQDAHILDVYKPERGDNMAVKEIIGRLCLQQDEFRGRFPVMVTNQEGDTFQFYEHYASFINIITGFIDSIVLILSAGKPSRESISAHGNNTIDYRINKVNKYLQSNFQKDESMKEIFDNIQLNYATVKGLYKKETGKTIKQYITELKLAKAADLLSSTDENITDIAFDCGYSSQEYFSNIFKKYYKLSPRKFRHRYQFD